MTEQRLFSNQRLIRLIIPLIIEQALTILVGMCDGVMVSSVGEAAISGVSLVDMINNVILVLFAALATGGAVVTSQFLGARQGEKARQSAGQLVLMSAVLGVAAAALCLVFAKNLMRLFFGSIDDDVMAAGLTYLHITALSFPFIALYNAGAAIFRSVGNSKVSMQVSLLMNGINVVGNAICIFVLKMGVAGVAVPTVVSRCVAAVVILWQRDLPDQNRDDGTLNLKKILLALGIGLGIGLYDGIMGPGTGTFAIIAFTTLMGFDLRTANGNGKVLNLASNYASLFTYLMNGLVVFHIGIPCAVSNILGNLLGSHFALKKGARFIRPMMLVVLVLLLGKLISDAVL